MVLVALTVAVGFFFAAPVIYYAEYYGTLLGSSGRVSIYHSAGCAIFGVGDTYVEGHGSGPYAALPGLSLGCLNPPLP